MKGRGRGRKKLWDNMGRARGVCLSLEGKRNASRQEDCLRLAEKKNVPKKKYSEEENRAFKCGDFEFGGSQAQDEMGWARGGSEEE